MTRWYRAYEGTVTDAKLGEAALVAECSRSVAIAAWHAILESCATVNDRGRFDATPRRVAVILCEPVKVIEALFAELEALGMIDGNVVSAWSNLAPTNDRPPASAWAILRALVFGRDNYTCVYCGDRGGRLECDHVVPVSRGGDSEPENLATACLRCNRSKKDKLLSEWAGANV